MKALVQMTISEFKLFVREPVGMFFTLAFPLLLLFIFGAIFGNEPTDLFGGLGSVDVSVPAYIGMIIGTLGLIGLPIGLAAYREFGILRRLRATPVSPVIIFSGMLIVQAVAALIGTLLLLIAGRLIFHLYLPQAPVQVFLAIVFSLMCFSTLSFLLAGLVATARTAQAVGMAFLMPMLFLSGAAMPRETLPPSIQRISDFLPLTHVVELLKGLWFGNGWNLTHIAVLAGMGLLSAALAARFFRWE